MGEGMGKTRRSKGETRELLLQTALALLPEVGFAGITTSRLTKALGVSQPAFYAHFKGLESLLDALVERVGEGLVSFAQEAQAELLQTGPGNPQAMVRHFIKVFERVDQNKAFFSLYLAHRLSPDPLGDRLRKIEATITEGIVLHQQENLRKLGVEAQCYEQECREEAKMINAILLGAYGLVLSDPDADKRRLAELVSIQIAATTMLIFAAVPQMQAIIPFGWKPGTGPEAPET